MFTVREVAAFVDEHGRFPAMTSTNSDEEKRLGAWLASRRRDVRSGLRAASPERCAYLDRVIPGWRRTRVRDSDLASDWTERIEAFATFREKHGRLPELGDPGFDALRTWRKSANDEVAATLDRLLPGWKGV